MKYLHIVFFAIGLIAFLGAAATYQDHTGLTLWRVGVAAMLTCLASSRLWPGKSS